jgi:selenocysteine-specific elongation factor
MEVKLFIWTSEVIARLRLLGRDELNPGETGWLQLELSQPVIAVRGDRFILRRPSPGETLGGGSVVDPHPKRRHKRFSAETLESLEALSQGSPAEVMLQAMQTLGAAAYKDLAARASLDGDTAQRAVIELLESGQIIVLDPLPVAGAPVPGAGTPVTGTPLVPQPNDLLASRGFWQELASQARREVEEYHRLFPLKAGMPREELKSRLKGLLKTSPRLFNSALRKLVAGGELVETGPLVRMPGHAIRFSPAQEGGIQRLMARFSSAPYAPPSVKECQAEVGEDVTAALIEMGRLVLVAPDVVYRQEDYQAILADLRKLFAQHGTLSAAQVRDHFNTSRKYVLALLEHLDTQGFTVREGDVRRLKSQV